MAARLWHGIIYTVTLRRVYPTTAQTIPTQLGGFVERSKLGVFIVILAMNSNATGPWTEYQE